MISYEDMEGNKFAQVCFGKGDDLFGKCQVKAMFSTDKTTELETAKSEKKTIKLKGKVEKKKFDEITIANCQLM